MVSIFAETVYNETTTVNFNDNDTLIVELPAQVSFPTVDISSIVGGFTYVESAVMEFNFVGGMDITSGTGNRNFRLDARPTTVFGSGIDLFSAVQEDKIFELIGDEIGGSTTIEDFSASIPIDSYVNTPLNIGYAFSVSGTDPSNVPPRANGAQTIDIEGNIILIGRQP